ncbi:unnamed protein product [Eruca vesicaria subsp. sativa]|uniref:Uncharacterized protein n=1 Tax=Eruca vesicaria subsp. sativa TaxID=29727 RepID=A0ABC8KMY4_ERUVS|nr:unnamed protein product [Eruca vesicaria subsp. sativa]
MEKEYGVNTVSLEMDRGAEEASGESQSESTLSNSPESGLTVESSRGVADSKKMGEGAGWTNEKHNSYLAYLENSFVKQLYSLLGGEETQRLSRTRDVQYDSHKSTDQFTVLQNGCRQKVNFGKKRPHLETSSGTPVQVKEEIVNSSDKNFTKTSMRASFGHQYPTQSTAEASGQNFREEVEEKGCDLRVSRKRRREANYDDNSLNDQVVP